ncbi:hypothetical protein [Streptomyces himalayensis]|uniref:Uncharacterized protein n=1 Tax=Streptomyces himalayensis subsp. himalayensis TaxID=2756131 RepID=A0A7W0IDP4_9ACTN|nr:hypothetical protein [Streptomyces himalayensis]MBA2951469.1 hypothetical protein [Streptomyces himalayensis subsp. himalayensis]
MTSKDVSIGRHPAEAGVRPPTEEERILGQIERGEVIAGPEGARRIAAIHQAAYGAVWDE